MKKHFKALLLITTHFVSTAIITSSSIVAAADPAIDCEDLHIPDDVKAAAGCSGNTNSLPSVIINIINGIIAVLGLVAVIYVVYGGVQYMTSAGDAGKAKKAKDTILYAFIGLIVCVLSYAIVNFVILNIIG